MTSIFNINWWRLVQSLNLKAFNSSSVLALLNTMICPIRTNYEAYLVFKLDADYRVKHNGQICYVQKMLNDKFDASLRRIKVRNIIPKEPLWAYYTEDNKPLFIYNESNHPTYFYNPEDYYNEFDFEVLIPTVLGGQVNQMMASINYYKLFSKNYKITTI